MISRQNPILLDTNSISACHEYGCWRAISSAFHLETVEACVVEFQTGGHAQRTQEYVDELTLRGQFKQIHIPTDIERATVSLAGGNALDLGERELWAHALGRKDVWVLCGPDRASMKFGCSQNCSQKLISLGMLLDHLKHPVAKEIPAHHKKDWLDTVRQKFVLGIN